MTKMSQTVFMDYGCGQHINLERYGILQAELCPRVTMNGQPLLFLNTGSVTALVNDHTCLEVGGKYATGVTNSGRT